ncbi:NAD-dependent epimerase/dehydratase [Solidesulfovibrio fructosivorans JJ]]|uniref:dTDP-4-dehydrorhamnose reductase n=1 Tax=Solidesulfovibrio fructosivorans JJ] TaxID=596151 RepID=E1JXP2_SOLFR|nr:SDR family oxidoreductase [Solidesulfovibrio fructosivorans]EFL50815.1 NAD-dependent epimerase/dehydratase [Solidesulfovibrio fructosivorans JJ]]
MRILVLGATGMLGHALTFALSRRPGLDVTGAARNPERLRGQAPEAFLARLRGGLEARDIETVAATMDAVRADVVINAVGLIRQLPEGRQPLPCIEVNARLPHQLLELCRARGARLIHISTDCVFDGHKGSPYVEEDPPTARDVYGLSKYLGEVREAPGLTLRTSIIGHELRNRQSLLEWFLGCREAVSGYANVLYSGLPTSELARVVAEYVLPRPQLTGLFQVASTPISKYELLRLVAATYGKDVDIRRDERMVEDKTLSGAKFYQATGYSAPSWPELVSAMHRDRQAFLSGDNNNA